MRTLQDSPKHSIRILSLLTLAALCMAFVFPGGVAGSVKWNAEYEAAFTQAKAESKVVFLAVNMDNERGNDRMVKDVYGDRTILKLSGSTVNLVASVARHNTSGKCSHLGTITCKQHRAVEGKVNGTILKPDALGHVVAPQHVWLDGDGKVLISVPYEVTAGELEWCFHEAGRRNDPDYAGQESSKSKRPRRWIPDGVYGADSDAGAQPPTRDETLELIKDIRKGMLKGGDLVNAYRRLAAADEPEAREYIAQSLKSGGGGRRGGRGGSATKIVLIRYVGLASPASYWEVLDSLVGAGEDALKNEVAVAMEQLAAPEALKGLTKAFKKEKDGVARKNLLRAIAACGAKDKGTRTLLLKSAKQTRDELLRRNALIGLGWQVEQADVSSAIEKVLAKGSSEDKFAAVVGMGISRDPLWLEKLKELAEAKGTDGDAPEEGGLSLAEAARAALEVHTKGEYRALGAALTQASGDTLARLRLFRPLKDKDEDKDEDEDEDEDEDQEKEDPGK
ncbi:MAG: hypothetical protein ACI9X4_000917 [Glaciecola sp.]|jgi:hypothetical protein